MHKEQPFVGENSPRISLIGSTPRGIRQSALFDNNRRTAFAMRAAVPLITISVNTPSHF
jgi:hypothetical protein